MIRVWLISYSYEGGQGRFFHYREDDRPPSREEIEETEVTLRKTASGALIMCLTRLGDAENIPDRPTEGE